MVVAIYTSFLMLILGLSGFSPSTEAQAIPNQSSENLANLFELRKFVNQNNYITRIILEPNQKNSVLMFTKGNFKIRVMHKYGNVLVQYENPIK